MASSSSAESFKRKDNRMRGHGGGSGSSKWGPRSHSPSRDSPRQAKRQERKFNNVLCYGTVFFVNYEKKYGMLTPSMASKKHNLDSGTGKNKVHFKVALGADQLSSTMTGGITLIKGDSLEYVLPDVPKERPSALRATLCKCEARKVEEVVDYVKSLVATAQEHPDIVLRNVTRCPAALRYVLDYGSPSKELLKHTLDLCHILQSSKLLTEVYRSRLKQMYALVSESRFLISEVGVQKYVLVHGVDESLRNLLKEVLIHILENIPSQLPQILPLLMHLGACEKLRSSNSIFSANLEAGEQLHNSVLPCEGGSFLMKVLNVVAGGRSQRPGSRQWAQLPLLPTMEEMKMPSSGRDSTLPVVRKKGAYGSPEDYIETYSRLLRADCFAGLLQGIQDLREGKLDDRDMKMWFGVTTVGAHSNHNSSPGLTFAMRLPQKKGRRASKAPDYGNLVCICDDGDSFDTPIWGIVRHCEEDAEKACICFVDIVVASGGIELGSAPSLSMQYSRLMKGEDMVMVESPTAYYAYQHVLDALRRTDPHTIPFKDELVSVTWPNKAPHYLQSPSTTLDWSCIFDPPEPKGWFSRCLSFIAGETEGVSASEEIRERVGGVTSLLQQGYKTSFDASQLKAVELAVNNRLTIIQGPPGTGKTYIACKLLQLLLSANTFPTESPVLVITFKNHALDQFLEKCLAFCNGEDSLVRVGSRSTNDKLEKYNLKNKENKGDDFRFERIENFRRTKEIQQHIESALAEVNKRLLSFDPLMVVTPGQLRYFTSRLRDPDRVQTVCAKELPEGFSLADLLVQDQYPEDADPEWVAAFLWLKKALVAEIEGWMPRPAVFKSVQECLSMKKPSSIKTLQHHVSGAKNATDEKEKLTVVDGSDEEHDTDEEERRSAYESTRQETKLEELDAKSKHFDSRNKNNQWLQNDFMEFSKEKDVHKASIAFSHLDILDGSEFDWLAHGDPYDLSPEGRAMLVFQCWQRSVGEVWQRVASMKAQYDTILQDTQEISQRQKLAILRKAKIIGMTTTGAAMHQTVLKCLAPAVILIEEAAEILEPNVLAVLPSNLQHLILIGDHQQLRPTVASYPLDRWHGFAVSMFERLVEHNKLPFQHLSQQCRMRDEFVPMLLPIYPFLKSHTALVSGSRNKAPTCMEKTMYFWSHTFQETSQRSYANPAEAHMVVALARWIVSELDNPRRLSILAAYGGQVTIIQKLLENYPELKGVEVNTIDRFQGAENAIVIVSLVRSNPTGKIGYLSDRSRLCVAVSRARAGVYLVGNHTTLMQKSADWRILASYFDRQQAISYSIPLRCPRHPNRPPFALTCTMASKFETSDVCDRNCEETLPCGHSCVRPCHVGAHSHPCKEQVRFTFRLCGHSQNKMCHEVEEELKCKTKVMCKFDNCEHTAKLDCWKVKAIGELPDRACRKDCEKMLQCGHMCTLRCSENCGGTPCTSCEEIEMKKERIAQQIQAKAKEDKLKELEVEIQALEAKGYTGFLVKEVHPSGDSAEDFYLAKERVEKSLQPDCKAAPVVTKVEKIENLQLQRQFLEAQKELISPCEIRKWLFYGGPDDLLDQVVNNGFRTRQKQHQEHCFDVYSSITAQERHGKLLLCEVQLGKTWRLSADCARLPGVNNLNLGKLRENGYDSVSLVADQESGREPKQAYKHVIYNPEQAIPKFIVSYRLVDFQALATTDGYENFGEIQARKSKGMCRVPLEPTMSFQGDNPEDYHFRMAESQFFRMSKNRKHKVTKVEVIVNLSLKERYFRQIKEFTKNNVAARQIFVFHGTDSGAIGKIATEGFKIGGTEGVDIKSGAVYGNGVYTAVNPDISVAYCRGSKMMLLSVAVPGAFPAHYQYGANKDVLVIKDVSQLLPRYVVHYS